MKWLRREGEADLVEGVAERFKVLCREMLLGELERAEELVAVLAAEFALLLLLDARVADAVQFPVKPSVSPFSRKTRIERTPRSCPHQSREGRPRCGSGGAEPCRRSPSST